MKQAYTWVNGEHVKVDVEYRDYIGTLQVNAQVLVDKLRDILDESERMAELEKSGDLTIREIISLENKIIIAGETLRHF